MHRSIGVFPARWIVCTFCGLLSWTAAGQETTVAVVPERWQPPQEHRGEIDFALAAQADAWLRHDSLGDPSFDSFQRRPGNPVVRGTPPFTWPVNGFLFEDPKSGNWYAYVGYYLTGYDVGPGKPPAHCRVHRSTDHGKTWQKIGPVFDDPKFCFQGDTHPANVAPDVSVVFADNRYHLVYDWFSDDLTWADAIDPPKSFDNGCAYAWSERPEGPFHRAPTPILRTSDMARRFDPTRKYRRSYAPSLVRRGKDWLFLGLADSQDHFSWGLMSMTAVDPAGPWSDPKMVLSDESDRFFTHTAETYPAMVHDGYVYAPYSSVGLNRNFQAIYRAKLQDAHRPEAWQLFQHGTAWHSEPVPNEGVGIWGQSYSGFVDRDGQFQVLFPSRESETNLGTINLATRPWLKPLRDRGFVLSGHGGPSLTLLRCAWRQFHLKADLALRAGKARIVWNYQAPLGPDRHAADATIHPLSLANHQGLELTADTWRIVSVDAAGKLTALANGSLEPAAATSRSIELVLQEDGRTRLAIDSKTQWEGELPVRSGPVGLLVDPSSNLEVPRFQIDGPFQPAVLPWLYLEALTGAGVTMTDWDVVKSRSYRFGAGAVRKTPGGRVKWNYRGRGFRLWSPKSPEFGRCELLLDGRKLADLDFHSESAQPSGIIHACDDADDGYHAVVLRSLEGRMPVDSLDVLN